MKRYTQLLLSIAIVLVFYSSIYSTSPHPVLIKKLGKNLVARPYYLQNLKLILTKGVNSTSVLPDGSQAYDLQNPPDYLFNALAILVNFSDNSSSVTATFFDSLLFSISTGTLNDYYDEVSYGRLNILTLNLPSSMGWQTAPQTYAYYVNGQNGFGDYPQNAQKLAEDVVAIADEFVDFSQYDNNSDDFVDALFIIHAGPGAEYTGSSDDMWSHKWSTSSPQYVDGVYVYTYSTEPEYWVEPGDMTCGVYAHEMGHSVFGLPDLYDRDGSSRGLGRWSLMASGSWNGNSGDSPAHPDAWSRIQMGYTHPQIISQNVSDASIPAIENDTTCYRLWTEEISGLEYFLVENREPIGYDAALPGFGLLTYHVDESVTTQNDNETHFLVALEQADGLYDLENNLDSGDGGDPYPGSTSNRTFDFTSFPNSRDYFGEDTYVAVRNISNAANTMTADFEVSETVVDPPEIDVAPLTVAFEVAEGSTGQSTITISNVAPAGAQNLNWAIYEQNNELVISLQPGLQVSQSQEKTAQRLSAPSRQIRFNTPAVRTTEAIVLAQNPNSDRLMLPNVGSRTNISGPGLDASEQMLILDDGTIDNTIGLSGGGQFVWLNRFTPNPTDFPISLNEIHVLFGDNTGVVAGELFDIYIYEDIDGDGDPGTGAVLAATFRNAAVQYTDDQTFTQIAIPPVVLNGPNDILIAVVNRTAGIADGDFPAALDQSSTQRRSWIGAYSGNPGDPPSLPADNLWGIIDDFGLSGNWMIRGYGVQGVDCPWITENPTSGSIVPGNIQDVILSVDATQLAPGNYTCDLNISSNDPDESLVVIPVSLTVTGDNQAPVLSLIPDQVVTEGQSRQVLVSAQDPDDDAITLTVNNLPGFAGFNDAGDGTGQIQFDPGFEDAGIYAGIEVLAMDDGTPDLSDTVYFDLTVVDSNRAPVLGLIPDQVVTEGQSKQVLVSAQDPDDDAITLTVNNLPEFADFTAGNGSGQIQFNPGSDDAGIYTGIEVVARDDGTPVLSDTVYFNLTVIDTNQAPVLGLIPDQVVTESQSSQVLVSAQDPDDDAITLAVNGLPGFAAFSDAGDGTGQIEFNPGFADAGNYAGIEVVARDDGNPARSDTVYFDLTVVDSNRAPLAVNDTIWVEEDIAVTFNVLTNDSDPDGDPLELLDITDPENGTVNAASGSAITYTPDPNFNGLDSCTYRLHDGKSAYDTAMVYFIIESQNDPPLATDDILLTDEDDCQSINLLVNDSDEDADLVEFHFIGTASHGTVTTDNDSLITYCPSPDFFGTDSFQYGITDGNGGLDSAWVAVNVNALPDYPVARPDTIELVEDAVARVHFLRNDSDVDGDQLIVIGFSAPAHGTMSFDIQDTALVYTAQENYFGPDSLNYYIGDGTGRRDTALVMIFIQGQNDLPTLTLPDSLRISTNECDSLDLWDLADDPETDDTSLNFAFEIRPNTVSFTYDPDSGYLKFCAGSSDVDLVYTVVILVTDPDQGQTIDSLVVFLEKVNTIGRDKYAAIPQNFMLEQNYPNPFNPITRIRYGVPRPSYVRIVIYDLVGHTIQTLVDRNVSAGTHEVDFDGGSLPSGIYFYRIEAGTSMERTSEFTRVRKMILLK